MSPIARSFPLLALLAWSFAAEAASLPPLETSAANPVPACVTPERLMSYLKSRNPDLDARYASIAAHYMRHGREQGLRWDYAFFQMIVETGGLTYRRGNGHAGAVAHGQNNFAGLGATGGREPGETFADVATGVKAHLQHVQLYTGHRVAAPIAERTKKVQEWGIIGRWQQSLGRATTFDDLARKWAPDTRSYAASLDAVARRYFEQHCLTPDPQVPVAVAPERPSGQGVAIARQALERAREVEDAPRSGLGAATIAPRPAEPRVAIPHDPRAPLPGAPKGPAVVAAAPPPAHPMQPPILALPPVDPADEALRRLVSGRTVLLDTPIGTTIPIEFAPDGRMRGKAGGLAGFLGAANDEGEWWVEKAQLCQRWTVWFKSERQCLRFKHSGRTIHWTSDTGRTGTARLAAQ